VIKRKQWRSRTSELSRPEMQTRYKKVAGSVCGFPKFVTSGSGFQKSNSGFGFGFRVRKFPKKTGFGVQVWVWFCKKHQNISKIPLEKLCFLYIEEI
jgi:hypothetical protein